jgi:GH25 family lysozyme M1 (1,4-beta-N-acetylmuramidase)
MFCFSKFHRAAALMLAGSLALSLCTPAYAAGTGSEDVAAAQQVSDSYDLPVPQTEDDPQYWSEYYKQQEGDQTSEEALDTGSPISLARLTTFSYKSPFIDKTYNVSGNQSNLSNGVDVSYYQGTIDWAAAKAAGVDFAIIRAAYRGSATTGNLVTDTKFKENLKNAKAAGVKVGIYIYSQATTVDEAEEEALYLLNLLGGQQLDLPVVFDQEFAEDSSGGFTGRLYSAYTQAGTEAQRIALLTSLAEAFCNTVAEGGYTPAVYASTSHYNNRMDITQIPGLIWTAQYSTNVTLNGTYEFWQYTSSGKVDGISGNVDCDFCVEPTALACSYPSNSVSLSHVVIAPTKYPKGTVAVSDISLAGSISSLQPLTAVSASITDEAGNVVQTVTDKTSATTYKIGGSALADGLKFSELELATAYTLTYTATDKNGAKKSWTTTFTLKAEETLPEETPPIETEPDGTPVNPVESKLAILPGSYPTGNISPRSYNLSGTITSNAPLKQVYAAICTADGTTVQEYTVTTSATEYTIANSPLDNNMRFSALPAGYYYLTYTATDVNGTDAAWVSPIFAVSPTTLFVDVTDSSQWYYNAVYSAAAQGIVQGSQNADKTYSYNPNSTLTRAEVILMLYRIAGSPKNATGASHPFQDAKASWYQDALIWAYQNNVVSGTSATTFAPTQPVTREQMATILYRYAKGEQLSTDLLSDYSDKASVSTWAKDGVTWCINMGIMVSTSTTGSTFSPKQSTKRSEAATLLVRYLAKNT